MHSKRQLSLQTPTSQKLLGESPTPAPPARPFLWNVLPPLPQPPLLPEILKVRTHPAPQEFIKGRRRGQPVRSLRLRREGEGEGGEGASGIGSEYGAAPRPPAGRSRGAAVRASPARPAARALCVTPLLNLSPQTVLVHCWAQTRQRRAATAEPNGFLYHLYEVLDCISPELMWAAVGPEGKQKRFYYSLKEQVSSFSKALLTLAEACYPMTKLLAQHVLEDLMERSEALLAHS
ncbi:uncharacterized protein [Petaurus breviceps papuanus]|uniref:uncharacterized protein n=1 Tax=Petaurus breviceps papuanus TaxID=3040969 RepID=UPI0036DF9129